MRRKLVIIFILVSIAIILNTFCYRVFAETAIDTEHYRPEDTITVTEDVGKLKTIGNIIIGLIRTIGSIASVGVLIVLGIKYMAASLEEKAKYKETMMGYVIGAALTFGILNILGIIIELAGVLD